MLARYPVRVRATSAGTRCRGRRPVTDRVKRSIVGDDLGMSPGRAVPSHTPAATAMQIAPVLHATDGALCSNWAPCPSSRRGGVVTDHAPVAHGDEIGAAAQTIDGEVVDDAGDVLGAARVLDVEEDGRRVVGAAAPAREPRRCPRRERGSGRVSGSSNSGVSAATSGGGDRVVARPRQGAPSGAHGSAELSRVRVVW